MSVCIGLTPDARMGAPGGNLPRQGAVNPWMKKSQKDFRGFLRGARAEAARDFAAGDARKVVAISTARGPATFLGPGGGIVAGAARVNRNNLSGAKHFAPGGITSFKVVNAEAADTLAFWSGLQRARMRVPGKPGTIPMTLRVTEVFRREGREWKLIHRHADPLARPSKPGR
ncbi:MAG TPA: nuclear transport factor 2 family protein [Lacunisphaera sp.]|nr:nuclear transport factor 2 family protein [Lacunisphaera sp.]